MTFDEYLAEKKIDSVQFKNQEPDRWQDWATLFSQISLVSFTAQKLYLINSTRRKYLLEQSEIANKPETHQAPKPVFKPKIQ